MNAWYSLATGGMQRRFWKAEDALGCIFQLDKCIWNAQYSLAKL